MKTVLVIAGEVGLADAVRAVLDPACYRVVHQADTSEAEPMLANGSVDVCILGTALTDIHPIRALERIRRAAPRVSVLVYTSSRRREWEEEALLLGVAHILDLPVRGRLLATLLERCGEGLRPAPPAAAPDAAGSAGPPQVPVNAIPALTTLHKFSGLLARGSEVAALLDGFLALLREHLGVNRAGIFLRESALSLAATTTPVRTFRCARAFGIPAAATRHLELSSERGLGASLLRSGRILRSGAPELAQHGEAQREFELLGVQVAVPILDRESLLGIVVLDHRVTGEPFRNEELVLVFHLLEDLGVAIGHATVHAQRAVQQEMLARTFDQFGSGCLVVAADTSILLANQSARALFVRGGADVRLGWADLPQALGSPVFRALESASAIEPFKWRSPAHAGKVFRVSLRPFPRQEGAKPDAVLVLIEDITQAERAHQAELETANLRLVRSMAERLAHEIGNAVVPLTTSQQLAALGDPALASGHEMAGATAESVRRIARLASQMQCLAQDGLRRMESVSLAPLLDEAFQDAHAQDPRTSAKLHYVSGPEALSVVGERTGLRHALAEILLNALQATPSQEPIEVTQEIEVQPNGSRWVRIDITDRGAGFTRDTARRATEPFFSTRTTGLGLGLTVSHRIIELHQGKLEIRPPREGAAGTVRVVLPLASSPGGLTPVQESMREPFPSSVTAGLKP